MQCITSQILDLVLVLNKYATTYHLLGISGVTLAKFKRNNLEGKSSQSNIFKHGDVSSKPTVRNAHTNFKYAKREIKLGYICRVRDARHIKLCVNQC